MEQEASYEELVKMHEYVTTQLKQKSIILDADDLQRNPGEKARILFTELVTAYQLSPVGIHPQFVVQWKCSGPFHYMKLQDDMTAFRLILIHCTLQFLLKTLICMRTSRQDHFLCSGWFALHFRTI